MKFEYDNEIYEDEGDMLIQAGTDHSTEQPDGSHVCEICGEHFLNENWDDLEMHIAWGHGLAKRIPETPDEIRMEKEYQALPPDLSDEERYRRIVEIVHGKEAITRRHDKDVMVAETDEGSRDEILAKEEYKKDLGYAQYLDFERGDT